MSVTDRIGAAVSRSADSLRVPKPTVYRRRQRESLVIFVIAVLVLPQFVHGFYGWGVANTAMLNTILALGFYYQFALSGQFSLATGAFYGVGAYTSAWASGNGGFVTGFIVAAIVAGLLGMGLKIALARSPLLHFAIATLAFGSLVFIVLRTWTSFTNGGGGKFGIIAPSLFGKDFKTPTESFYLSAGIAFIGLVLLVLFERSAAQRDWVFVRDMPTVARTSGLPVSWVGIAAFGVGAAYMGAAGSMAAHTQGFIDLNKFTAVVALDVLIMVLLGGIRSVWGPVVGALVITVLPEWLRDLQDYKELVYAILILLVILVLPNGLTSLPGRVRMAIKRRPAAGAAT